DLPTPQRRVSMLLRTLILLLLVLGLCGLTLLSPTHDQHVVFLIDESASLGQDARDATLKYIQSALVKQGRNQVSYLPFARTPKTVGTTAPTAPPPTDKPTPPDAAQKEWSHATDIAAAVGVATAALPPSAVGRLVLLTDGN